MATKPRKAQQQKIRGKVSSTPTVMRIRISDLLLGIILLLGLPLAPKAYDLNVPRRSLPRHGSSKFGVAVVPSGLASISPAAGHSTRRHERVLPHLQATRSHHSMETESLNAESVLLPCEHMDNSGLDEAKKTNHRTFVGLLVAALIVFSQYVGVGSKGATFAPDVATNKNVLYTAVSATLLRRQKGQVRILSPWNFQFLMFVGLCFQFAQADRLLASFASFGSLFSSWYMSVLTQFPLITKAMTTAMIGMLGDTTAQFLEERVRAKKEGSRIRFRNYDRRRGLAVLGDAVLISGPLMHFAYNILESAIPVAGPFASLAALTQVVIDDFIIDPLFVAIMFVTTGIAEGYTREIIPQFRKDFFSTVKAGWATSLMLMPLEFMCFRFLPLNFRVLGMNGIDIIWEAMISYMIHRRRKMAKSRGTMGNDENNTCCPAHT